MERPARNPLGDRTPYGSGTPLGNRTPYGNRRVSLESIVLGSTSPYRRALLERLRIPVETAAPEFDEENPRSVAAPEEARRLALRNAWGKWQSLRARFAGRWLLTSDQVGECEGRVLGKAANLESAVEQLAFMAGKEHRLHTAVVLGLATDPSSVDAEGTSARASSTVESRSAQQTPGARENQGGPESPENPGGRENQGGPEDPENPGAPEIPGVPEDPGVPESPSTPGSRGLETAVSTSFLRLRPLDLEQIRRYVEIEQPFDAAGSYYSEAFGIVLFEYLRGDDPTAIIGLPLVTVARMLRAIGHDPLDR